jgi:hypothetical protein
VRLALVSDDCTGSRGWTRQFGRDAGADGYRLALSYAVVVSSREGWLAMRMLVPLTCSPRVGRMGVAW